MVMKSLPSLGLLYRNLPPDRPRKSPRSKVACISAVQPSPGWDPQVQPEEAGLMLGLSAVGPAGVAVMGQLVRGQPRAAAHVGSGNKLGTRTPGPLPGLSRCSPHTLAMPLKHPSPSWEGYKGQTLFLLCLLPGLYCQGHGKKGLLVSVFLTICPLLPPRACAHAGWLLPLWEPQHSLGASPREAPSQLAGVERPLLPGARTGLAITPIDSSRPSLRACSAVG